MGVCSSMKTEKRLVLIPLVLQKFYYLNTKEKSLYMMEGQVRSKILLPEFKIHKKSAIGTLSNSDIIIGGGMKLNKQPSKRVIKISPSIQTVTKLPPLRLGIYHGSFYTIDSTLFYISSDLNVSHQAFHKNTWEFVYANPIDLHSATTYLIATTVFFAFGIKPNKKPTKKIYSIDFLQSKTYKLEKNRPFFKLISPFAIPNTDFLVFAGGFTISQKPNYSFYIQKNGKWKEIAGPECVYLKNSCRSINNHTVLISTSSKIVTINQNLQVQVLDFSIIETPVELPHHINPAKPKIGSYRRNSCEMRNLLSNFAKLSEKASVYSSIIEEVHSCGSAFSENSIDSQSSEKSQDSEKSEPIEIHEMLSHMQDGETIDTPNCFKLKLFSAGSMAGDNSVS